MQAAVKGEAAHDDELSGCKYVIADRKRRRKADKVHMATVEAASMAAQVAASQSDARCKTMLQKQDLKH
jgi:hypothetical protein